MHFTNNSHPNSQSYENFILEAFHEGSQLSRRHYHVANLGNSRGVAGHSEKDLNNGLSNSLSCLKSKNKQKQYDFERKKKHGKKGLPVGVTGLVREV